MKKLCIAAMMATTLASCLSKGNQNILLATESEDSAVFIVDNGLWDELESYCYEGTLPAADASGIDYQLILQETGEDSIGTYSLTTSYLDEKDNEQVFMDHGTVITLFGTPYDSDAVVYQLISSGPTHERTNFLVEGADQLTLIGKDFRKAESALNYTLKKKL